MAEWHPGPALMDDQIDTAKPDDTRRDGFASMAILALTVAFIVVVLIAII